MPEQPKPNLISTALSQGADDTKYILQFAILIIVFMIIAEFAGKKFATGLAVLIVLSMIVVNANKVGSALGKLQQTFLK